MKCDFSGLPQFAPRFKLSDVMPIAANINRGPAQWPRLAQHLQAARSCKRMKGEEFAKQFEGAKNPSVVSHEYLDKYAG